jgi:hypothetical protein
MAGLVYCELDGRSRTRARAKWDLIYGAAPPLHSFLNKERRLRRQFHSSQTHHTALITKSWHTKFSKVEIAGQVGDE